MAIEIDAKSSALIIQDLQNDVIIEGGAFADSGAPAHATSQNVVANAAAMATAARAAGMAVIHVHYIVEPGAPGLKLNAPLFQGVKEANALVRGTWGAAAADGAVRMIEIKLSQGAKPGQGGMLPSAKITPEIAEARGIPMGKDCMSPASHSAFNTPLEMMEFIAKLRYLSGGKPVGFKLCIGHRREFMCIVRAMLETGITPDFIVVDGKEGGTGAAPLEFANHMGMPLVEGLTFVHNTLRGVGLRDQIRIGASGKLIHAFDIARTLALGADWCNSARGFMFAVGCIQAQACHTNHCPTGVATQDKTRQKALVVPDKAQRVANFHRNTLKALGDMTGSAGLSHPSGFLPRHLLVRVTHRDMQTGDEVYPYMPEGFLLREDDERLGYLMRWRRSSSASFQPFDDGI